MKSGKAKMACATKIYLIFMILCAQKSSYTCTHGRAAHAVFTLTQLVDPKAILRREVLTHRYYIIVRY